MFHNFRDTRVNQITVAFEAQFSDNKKTNINAYYLKCNWIASNKWNNNKKFI